MSQNNFKLVSVFEPESREFQFNYKAQPDPEQPGEYITPTHSCEDLAPETKKGEAAFRGALGGWEVRPDFRGEIVYNQEDGKAVVVESAGPIPAGFALEPPPPTVEQLALAALAQRADLLAQASTAMGPLQDAEEVGVATAEEQAELLAWKQYRIALSRIQLQEGYPNVIAWPISPAEQ